MRDKWPIKTLEEICEDLFAGGDVPKDRLSEFKTDNYQIPIYSNGAKDDGLYGFTNKPRVTKPSVTVSARGTIGYTSTREKPFLPVVRLIVLTPNQNIVTLKFLKYVVDGIDFLNTGTSIPQLTVPMVKKYTTPIPPLPEQKRIVAILDEAFEAIAKAKANVERNIQNAEELFQSKLEEVFKQLSEQDKITYQLKDVCEYDKITNEKVGIPYVGLADIESDSGRFIGDLSPREMKSRTFYFNENHLLYGRLRPYLNKILVSDFEGHCSTEIFPIKTSNLISKSFLFYWFLKPTTVNKIDKTSTGARMPRANMDDVMNFEIPVPSIEVQKELVDQLIKIKENSLEISQLYKYKKVQLEELKKSILQKAFSGELTANEHVAA